MRFVKPIDKALILELANQHELLITVEENAVMGGAGSSVLEVLASSSVQVATRTLGIPDKYIEQDSPAQQKQDASINAEAIQKTINDFFIEPKARG